MQRFPLTVFPDAVGMRRGEDRSNMLVYGAMVFGGFGPVTPWYEELMKQAESVSAWIMERCQRDALAPGGIGAAIYAQADTGVIEEWEATLLVRSLLSAGVDTTIDSIGFGFHLRFKLLVTADAGPARGPDLNEREFLLITGIKLEKHFDPAESLRNSLGVIDAIDANAKR